jgi:hypothetical protein
MKLADINLPFLHNLFLILAPGDAATSRVCAAAFITAQRTVRKLYLRGRIGPVPPVPCPIYENWMPQSMR